MLSRRRTIRSMAEETTAIPRSKARKPSLHWPSLTRVVPLSMARCLQRETSLATIDVCRRQTRDMFLNLQNVWKAVDGRR